MTAVLLVSALIERRYRKILGIGAAAKALEKIDNPMRKIADIRNKIRSEAREGDSF